MLFIGRSFDCLAAADKLLINKAYLSYSVASEHKERYSGAWSRSSELNLQFMVFSKHSFRHCIKVLVSS